MTTLFYYHPKNENTPKHTRGILNNIHKHTFKQKAIVEDSSVIRSLIEMTKTPIWQHSFTDALLETKKPCKVISFHKEDNYYLYVLIPEYSVSSALAITELYLEKIGTEVSCEFMVFGYAELEYLTLPQDYTEFSCEGS